MSVGIGYSALLASRRLTRYPGVLPSAAFLEFLPAPTRAGLVPSHLGLIPAIRFWHLQVHRQGTEAGFVILNALLVFIETRPPPHFLDNIVDQGVAILHSLQGRPWAFGQFFHNLFPGNESGVNQTLVVGLTKMLRDFHGAKIGAGRSQTIPHHA